MTMLRLRSASAPFAHPEVAGAAARLLALVETSGIWAPGAIVDTLDDAVFHQALVAMADAGVAGHAPLQWRGYAEKDADTFSRWINGVRDDVVQSPVPEWELPKLDALFGTDRLADLIGVGHSSLRRYLSATRAVPDDVAVRGHLVTEIVSALAGSFNERGIRRWFERPRSQLGGKTPAETLIDAWDRDGMEVADVVALATQRSG
jgi:hypothetical protein